MLLHVAIQSVFASERGIAYVANEFELEMGFNNMADDAFLVHNYATL